MRSVGRWAREELGRDPRSGGAGAIVLILLVIVACILLGAYLRREKRDSMRRRTTEWGMRSDAQHSSAARLGQEPGLAGRSDDPAAWTGLRRTVLDIYLQGEKAVPKGCRLEACPEPWQPVRELRGGGMGDVRVQITPIGRKVLQEFYRKNYLVEDVDGREQKVAPSALLDPQQFTDLRRVWLRGGDIQMLPFPRGQDVPERNALLLMPGSGAEDSFIVELMGVQHAAPDGFDSWDPSYAGKSIAKICSLDTTTGLAGRRVGWIVDVLSARLSYYAKASECAILKKFIKEVPDVELPQYVVARPYGLISEGENDGQVYHGEVIDDAGNPHCAGAFCRFVAGKLINGLNND